jgi:hypothetical protein
MTSKIINDDVDSTRGHAAHDSALGSDMSKDYALKLKDLEEQNDILAEKAASACECCLTREDAHARSE